MQNNTERLLEGLKKGDYILILDKAKKKNPNISYDNVLAYFNKRVVAEEKMRLIYSAGKAVYKKRTGKKFEEE